MARRTWRKDQRSIDSRRHPHSLCRQLSRSFHHRISHRKRRRSLKDEPDRWICPRLRSQNRWFSCRLCCPKVQLFSFFCHLHPCLLSFHGPTQNVPFFFFFFVFLLLFLGFFFPSTRDALFGWQIAQKYRQNRSSRQLFDPSHPKYVASGASKSFHQER